MSADEGFDNDAIHMGIEAAPPTQSLAGSTVPLALMPPTPSPSDTLSPSTSQVVVMNSGTTPVVQSTTPTDERRSIVSAPGRVAITGSPNATTTIALRSPLLLTRSNARRIRGRNRPRYNMNQRSLENYPTEVHSAPTGFFQQTGSCMFALPSSSSSTSSLSHSTVTVNESILSLLINLHSKLTNESDSYKPGPMNESRIGDGPYFIKRLIDLYVKLNVSSGQKSVENWRERLWPKPELPLDDPLASSSSGTSGATDETEEEKNARLKEERRRKARERQQKLMAEFASKQMAFMRNMEKEQADTGGDMEEEPKAETEEESSFVKMPEYECVICNQTCPSTVDRLMGMVTLLQSTSVLAHSRPSHRIRRPEDKENSDHALPCEESQLKKNSSRWTLAKYMEKKIDYLSIEFPSSWFNALSIGWEGGVHVQTCGHYLHLDCHKSYLKSLRTTHGTRHGLEQGEYACPLCRQMANSVLPVTPDIGQYGAMVHSRNPFDAKAVAQEITDLLTNVQPPNANLIKLLGGFMEDLTKATPPQFRSIRANPTTQSLFLFLCSIIRTNIEAEVLVRLSKSSQSGLKKSFVYLFHVLALNAKVFIHQPYTPIWSQLTGLPLPDDEAMIISQMDKEVPVLLKDVTSLLIQLIFSVPLNVDKAYYTGIVQMLYNLNFVQAMVQQSCAMQDSERQRLREVYLSGQKDGLGSDSSFLWNISSFLGVLIDILSHSSLYERTETEPSVVQKVLTSGELVDAASSVCLPFMRAASVLQSHLYGDNYPSAIEVDGDNEFDTLRTFLGLHDQQLKGVVSVLGAANWPNQLPLKVIKSWCQELIQFVQVSLITSRKLLLDKPITLETPSLLRLPHTYDQLFLFYHSLKCSKCNRTPKEPCVCLVCGTLVCMREQCCRSSSSQTLEAVSHSEVCGAGTTIYLAINSSTIIVIRGKRACVWGSVYLDSYGEEDRDLKRGKPLYLSEQRYHILEQQWLTHSFDHTNKRWVWHKDGL
ncbi:E3 ubiquitin-protein ligase UBR3 [Halotydeus destructor]|nr:E3 ubiquitin-protein ligase UBR3 [Halotydeus destructor]